MPNPLISHIEIPSTDVNRSSDFFKKVFDWDFKPIWKWLFTLQQSPGDYGRNKKSRISC